VSAGYSVTDAAGALLFEDMVIELDQYYAQPGEELKQTVLNIRLFMLTSQPRRAVYNDSFVVSERTRRVQKRDFQMSGKRRNQKNTAIHSALKLAISEETIGLQTKLQIYDYVFTDYMLNASEYVKERIQIVAPQNLMNIYVFTDYMLNASEYVKERIQIVAPQNLMNITQAFDFEEGSGLNQIQIIFKRKTNNRPSKF